MLLIVGTELYFSWESNADILDMQEGRTTPPPAAGYSSDPPFINLSLLSNGYVGVSYSYDPIVLKASCIYCIPKTPQNEEQDLRDSLKTIQNTMQWYLYR